MKEEGYTQKTLSAECHMGEVTFNLSINNKRCFRQNEMEDILSCLNEPLSKIEDYFYAK